jgi:hypothetical protein
MVPLILVIVALAVWMLAAPGNRFVNDFAALLTNPVLERNAFSFFSGRSYLTGAYANREVAVRLQLKRGKYQLGYLVIAMRTQGARALDASAIDARTRGEAGRRALFTLAAQDLLLSVEDGWLKTLWRPYGFMIFPGRFSETKWRPVLDAMQAVAGSLDTVD